MLGLDRGFDCHGLVLLLWFVAPALVGDSFRFVVGSDGGNRREGAKETTIDGFAFGDGGRQVHLVFFG